MCWCDLPISGFPGRFDKSVVGSREAIHRSDDEQRCVANLEQGSEVHLAAWARTSFASNPE